MPQPARPCGGDKIVIICNVVAVSANNFKALVLTSDGTVLDFGLDPNGENEIRPGLSNVISVVSGANSFAVRRDGTVAMWGHDKDEANVVDKLSNVVSIASAGFNRYLALKNDGVV